MEYPTYVEHVRLDGQRLKAAANGSLSLEVPSCPKWTVRDLVSHVAQVYEHKITCTSLGRAPDPWPPGSPAVRDVVASGSDGGVLGEASSARDRRPPDRCRAGDRHTDARERRAGGRRRGRDPRHHAGGGLVRGAGRSGDRTAGGDL